MASHQLAFNPARVMAPTGTEEEDELMEDGDDDLLEEGEEEELDAEESGCEDTVADAGMHGQQAPSSGEQQGDEADDIEQAAKKTAKTSRGLKKLVHKVNARALRDLNAVLAVNEQSGGASSSTAEATETEWTLETIEAALVEKVEAKAQAVNDENYDLAKHLKAEIEVLQKAQKALAAQERKKNAKQEWLEKKRQQGVLPAVFDRSRSTSTKTGSEADVSRAVKKDADLSSEAVAKSLSPDEYLSGYLAPLLQPLLQEMTFWMPDDPHSFVKAWIGGDIDDLKDDLEKPEDFKDEHGQAYLEATAMPVLTGVLDLCLQNRPSDPKSFLAEHLDDLGLARPDSSPGAKRRASSGHQGAFSLDGLHGEDYCPHMAKAIGDLFEVMPPDPAACLVALLAAAGTAAEEGLVQLRFSIRQDIGGIYIPTTLKLNNRPVYRGAHNNLYLIHTDDGMWAVKDKLLTDTPAQLLAYASDNARRPDNISEPWRIFDAEGKRTFVIDHGSLVIGGNT